MKIGILTLPLGINYGGILQCYALSSYLKTKGHETIVIRRERNRSFFLVEWLRSLLRILHFPRYYSPRLPYNRMENISYFIEDEINWTSSVRSQLGMLRVCRKYKLDAVIVGSDQVWRRGFAKEYGFNFFLDFVPKTIKKLSYAASFGINQWEYDSQQTMRIRELLKSFSGVSVREEEAVSLCLDHMETDAKLVVDPTLLLTSNEYDLIASSRLVAEKYVFVYWLGDKSQVVQCIEDYKKKGYSVVYVGLRGRRVLPSVGDWLSYIKYADVVVTDSFHSCVFSLLYHRSLHIFENKSGGFGRIKTLLRLLNISDSNLMQLSEEDIKRMECSLESLRASSWDFLEKSITA